MAMSIGMQSGLNAARELDATMPGRIVLPDASSYHGARQIWNGAVDHHPAVIAYCENPAEGPGRRAGGARPPASAFGPRWWT